jgi:cytochrome c biogenesis protein CcdA
MIEASYGVALGAGVLAAFNPCGFALLPAYVTLLVAGDQPGDQDGRRLAAVGRALLLTGAMAIGFVAVFGGFGLLAASAADVVAQRLPWVTVAVGLALVVLGGWLLAGLSLPAFTPRFVRGPRVTRRFGSMVLFGAAYAVVSLGCTIGLFTLTVIITGFRQGSALAGFGHLLAYAAGMALVIGSVALAVALARVSLVRGLRRATPWLARGGGGLLLLAGGYVAWYGGYELRLYGGGSAEDPVIDAVGLVQRPVESWLDSLGLPVVAGAFAGLLLLTLAVVVLVGRARRRARVTAEPELAPEPATDQLGVSGGGR